METKQLFIIDRGIAYDFIVTKLSVTSPSGSKILRYKIDLNSFDTIFIEQDRYDNWTQLVEKGLPISDHFLQKVGDLVQKSFT